MTVVKENLNPDDAAIKAALAAEKPPTNDKEQAPADISTEDLLFAFPAIEVKLREALLTRHFLITISCQKTPARGAGGDDLLHYWECLGYPPADVPKSLRHMNADLQQFQAEKIIDMLDHIEDYETVKTSLVAKQTAKILAMVFEGVAIDSTMRHLVNDYLSKNFPASTPEGSGEMR